MNMVVHKSSGKKLGYGDLASAAAKLPVPKKEELQLKPRKDWVYIGKAAPAYDLKDMSTGKAIYGQDAKIDGMLFASVVHPPVFGSAVKSVDDSAALKVAGVKQTATIDAFKPPVNMQALGGVAVIADSTYAAFQGKKKLKIEWTKSEHDVWTSDTYRKYLEDTARERGRRCGVCQRRKNHRSRILCADAGARRDGASGSTSRVSRWKGRGLGSDTESSRRSRSHCRRSGN
jgi:isoquinoline 1-oxidoreductase beta subunit